MIVIKRDSMASLIHDTCNKVIINKGLYYGFRDAILSRLITIIKCLVHHAVYCISLSCLLYNGINFMYNSYALQALGAVK